MRLVFRRCESRKAEASRSPSPRRSYALGERVITAYLGNGFAFLYVGQVVALQETMETHDPVGENGLSLVIGSVA